MSEQNVSNVQETGSKKKKGLLVLVLAIALFGAIAVWLFATGKVVMINGEARALAKELKKDGTATIVLDEDVVVSSSLVVNGKKTITGKGKIILDAEADIAWPELEQVPSFGGAGCPDAVIHDTSSMTAVLKVSSNAKLTINNAGVDASKVANVCQVEEGGSLTVTGNATLENGRYCNVDVRKKAEFTLKSGSVLNGENAGIINNGTTQIEGGLVSGTVATNGALVYSTSKLIFNDGVVEKSAGHNIYVAAGEFEMTGGTNGYSKGDGIMIKADATANITGGTHEGHIRHAIHNNGKTTAKNISVVECGMVNGSKGQFNLDKVNVKGAYVFPLANEGGKVTANEFSTVNCETVAICNLSGEMNLTNIDLKGGRDGNISIIKGDVNIDGAILDRCREKSVSISGGKVNIKNIEVQGTAGKFNGVYVFGGELYMENASIANTGDCGFRVDQAGFAEVKNLTIKDTVSTAIFGGGGIIEGDGVTAENIGGHGIYNTGGKVTISNFNIKKVRNVIQQRKGETVLNNIVADDMELGAYCQEGTLTINGGKFSNSKSNGLRVKEKTTGGLPTLNLKNVEITDVAFHGISNMGIFNGENVTIRNAGMNGFYNKDTGKATVKGLKVYNITAYGISNGLKANLNMSNVTVEKVGLNQKNNAVHNLGTMVVNGLTIKGNDRNGIYNVGKLSGKDITVSDIKENGIYNNTDITKTGFKGQFNVENVTVHDVGSQGVTNMREATLKVKNLVVYNVPENGLRNHNSGIADVNGGKIYNVDKHGINNDSSTLTLKNFEIYDTNRANREFNLLNNSGKLTGNNINLHGKAFRALYTNSKGTVSITGLKADGAGLENVVINGKLSESKCVVSNNAGVMTLKNSEITNAKEMALYTISGAKTTLSNVTIDKAGTHGISAQGNTTTNATNLTIKNVTGTAVYNNGVMTSKGLKIEDCMHGVSCRSNGRTTLSGNTVIKNMEKTAIQTWGDEKKSNDNRITIAENAKVSIDGTGYHAVLNRGQLLMYKSASITVKNVGGIGSNAIYNHNTEGTVTPVMKLGKVTVSGIKSEAKDATVVGDAIANRGEMTLLGDVTVSDFHASGTSMGTDRNYAAIMNMNGTIKGNANVTVLGEAKDGVLKEDTLVTGVYVEGGTVSLGNITVKNARSHGIQVKKAGTLTLANGAKVDIDTTAKHAILNAGTFITDETSNISIKNVGGTGSNAIYNYDYDNSMTPVMKLGKVTVEGINVESNASVQGNAIANRGEMTLLGDVTVSGIHASGANINSNRNYAGITNFSGNIKGENANVTVTGAVTEGVVNEDTMAFGVFVEEGTVTLGNIKVTNARQRAVHLGNEGKAATLNAKDIVIDYSADRGIYMQNKTCAINVAESISVNKTGNHGIYAPSPITVGKDVTIKNVVGTNNANGFHVDAAVKVGGNILIDGVSGVTNGDNQGNGLVVTSAGTLDVEGNVTIKNITSTGATDTTKPATAATNGLFTRGNTTIKGEVVIDNIVKGNAVLCTNALLQIEKLTITNATAREAMLVYSNGKVEVNGGSITGAYGTTASDDDPDLGIVTVRNAAAKVTLNNFAIKDTGGCQYGIVTRIDAPTVETTNLTLEGCGIMAKGGSGKYTLNGITTIKDYDENGIHLIQTGSITLSEGAELNISHPGEKNHAEAIYLNNSGAINGPKAAVNISDIKGETGHGIHMVGTRSVAATLLVGTMTIDNCAKYAITADKEVKNINKVYIGSLKVTNCGFENALNNVNSDCYVLAP